MVLDLHFHAGRRLSHKLRHFNTSTKFPAVETSSIRTTLKQRLLEHSMTITSRHLRDPELLITATQQDSLMSSPLTPSSQHSYRKTIKPVRPAYYTTSSTYSHAAEPDKAHTNTNQREIPLRLCHQLCVPLDDPASARVSRCVVPLFKDCIEACLDHLRDNTHTLLSR